MSHGNLETEHPSFGEKDIFEKLTMKMQFSNLKKMTQKSNFVCVPTELT